MRKGDIIRKALTSVDAEIGPYMRIEVIQPDRVYASVLNKDNPNHMLLKQHVVTVSHHSLAISADYIEKIKNNKRVCITNPVGPRWDIAYNKNPKIVRFYNPIKKTEVYVMVEFFKKTYSLCQKAYRMGFHVL